MRHMTLYSGKTFVPHHSNSEHTEYLEQKKISSRFIYDLETAIFSDPLREV